MRLYGLLALAAISLFACHTSDKKDTSPDFLAQNIDTTVSPATDFFTYANGGWIKKNAIPAEEGEWGIGQLVQEDLYNRLKKINESATAEKAAPGTVTQQIGDFWYSGMDSADIERQSWKPLQPDLDTIMAIRNTADLLRVTALLHLRSSNALFSEGASQDDKHSDQMAYQLWQGGLGLPTRDYYFNKDAPTTKVREAYRHYLTATFRELGRDSIAAKKEAEATLQLETRLAKASRKLEDLRDPNANYHKLSISELQKLTPQISWKDWFAHSHIPSIDSVIVGQPEFYTALNTEITKTSLADWKSYLTAQLIRGAAPFLDHQTYANYFAYIQVITGASAPKPRWKRVLDAEERSIGEALGQLFVKEYFPAAAKQRYSDLVENIRAAYKERIEKLDWMSDSTKSRALYKLSLITKKVGYPDKWKDFSALKIDRGPFVLNMARAATWWHNYNISKIGKPVDRTEWGMSPQTYNASYNPSNNEITLPAGIFAVPNKKDEDLDDAFVYGYAAASTIGHEITHGFDDQGRQYDEKGNLHDWWQAPDTSKFKTKASFIIRQFSEFSPVDTLHINGDATQGENIADLGGLLLGLDAFKKTSAYSKNEKIGGLTPLQRYFLGYAYGWMYQDRKEQLAAQVMSDVHAPAKERVNGPVVNIPEFYEAFGVKPGDKMYRPDSLRVKIW